MNRENALEAAPIVEATLNTLLQWAPTRGLEGADLRSAVNDIKGRMMQLLQGDALGDPVANCFDLAYQTGISLAQTEQVRRVANSYNPVLLGALMIRDSLIQFALVTQSRIIAFMTFVSREDVDKVKAMFSESFDVVEESLADRMDAMTYRSVIELHAAISFFLVETARPLPRMLNYRFNQHLPTLVMAQRLYYDASRADELLKENKIVHPAFSPRSGHALSS